jgi:hypothetical protein
MAIANKQTASKLKTNLFIDGSLRKLFDCDPICGHSTRYLDQPVPLNEQNSRVVDLLITEGATIMPFVVPKLWTQHFCEEERDK